MLTALLRQAATCCPNAEVLWIMWAKEEWRCGDCSRGGPGTRPRDVLQPRQQGRLADRRQARVGERRDSAHARLLLQMACARAPSAKVWMKLALLKRECDGGAGELPTLDDAIAKNPTSTSYT